MESIQRLRVQYWKSELSRLTFGLQYRGLCSAFAPTGRKVEVPLVAIVKFVGGKVAHEHIYWDQASVLVQVGLLDSKGLPVAGVETARKVADNALPSNALMTRWPSSAGKPI